MAKSFRKVKNLVIDVSSEANTVVTDLLRVLKSKYDYRALSAITGIPVSTLTRYITGKTSPKGAKAEKLLRNLLSNVNLTALIMNDVSYDGDGLNLAEIMLNPSIVKIIGAHVINEFIGMKITSFLALDLLSIPLVTYLASVTSRPMYVISPEPVSVNGDSTPVLFTEGECGFARAYWLLMRKRSKKESVLAISSQTPNPNFFNSLLETLRKLEIELGGFFSVVAKEDELKKLKIPPGVKRSYILLG